MLGRDRDICKSCDVLRRSFRRFIERRSVIDNRNSVCSERALAHGNAVTYHSRICFLFPGANNNWKFASQILLLYGQLFQIFVCPKATFLISCCSIEDPYDVLLKIAFAGPLIETPRSWKRYRPQCLIKAWRISQVIVVFDGWRISVCDYKSHCPSCHTYWTLLRYRHFSVITGNCR